MAKHLRTRVKECKLLDRSGVKHKFSKTDRGFSLFPPGFYLRVSLVSHCTTASRPGPWCGVCGVAKLRTDLPALQTEKTFKPSRPSASVLQLGWSRYKGRSTEIGCPGKFNNQVFCSRPFSLVLTMFLHPSQVWNPDIQGLSGAAQPKGSSDGDMASD